MATKKKPSAARKKAQRTTKAKSRKPTSRTKNSVDSLLRSYEKEQVTLASNLEAARKKIETMVKKIDSMKTNLEQTRRKVVETETAIETLHTRRDNEIGELPHKLGVSLDSAAAAAKAIPTVVEGTPLFEDESESEEYVDVD